MRFVNSKYKAVLFLFPYLFTRWSGRSRTNLRTVRFDSRIDTWHLINSVVAAKRCNLVTDGHKQLKLFFGVPTWAWQSGSRIHKKLSLFRWVISPNMLALSQTVWTYIRKAQPGHWEFGCSGSISNFNAYRWFAVSKSFSSQTVWGVTDLILCCSSGHGCSKSLAESLSTLNIWPWFIRFPRDFLGVNL